MLFCECSVDDVVEWLKVMVEDINVNIEDLDLCGFVFKYNIFELGIRGRLVIVYVMIFWYWYF